MAQQFEEWYKVTKDNIPKFNINMLRKIEKELEKMKELPGKYPDNDKIIELLKSTRARMKDLENIEIISRKLGIEDANEMQLKEIEKFLDTKIENIGKSSQRIYNISTILFLQGKILERRTNLDEASKISEKAVKTLPSVPKPVILVKPVITVSPSTWGDLEPNTSYSGDPYAPMARFRARKANKSVRKVKKSARKSTRKVKKSARKSTRKVKKSVRKSNRKVKKSARKSTRKVKKSVRKSPRKIKKSVRKSVKKSVRKLKARH